VSLLFSTATSQQVRFTPVLPRAYESHEFTWAFVIYPTVEFPAALPMFGKMNTGGSGRIAWVDFGQCAMEIGRASGNAISKEDGTPPIGTWSINFFRYRATDGPRIFRGLMNNHLREVKYSSRDPGAGALSNGSTDFSLGNDVSPDPFTGFDGRMQYAYVWDRPLRFAEMELVRKHWDNPPVRTGLVFAADLDRKDSGGQVIDWAGGSLGTIDEAVYAERPNPRMRRISVPSNYVFAGGGAAPATFVRDFTRTGGARVFAFAR
jgi:hypothetical protein